MPNRSPDVFPLRNNIGWYIIKYLLIGMLLGAVLDAPAQSIPDPEPAMEQEAGRLVKEVEEKIERINHDLLCKSIRYLQATEAAYEKRKLKKRGQPSRLI